MVWSRTNNVVIDPSLLVGNIGLEIGLLYQGNSCINTSIYFYICGTIFGSTERELLESWLASWGRITSRSRCCGRGSALLLHFFKFRVFNCMHLQMLFHCAGIASFYVDL